METNNNKQELTETTGSVKVEVRIQANTTRSEGQKDQDGNVELVPVSEDKKDFTINFELSSEKIRNFMQMFGEAAGQVVKDKISNIGK